MAKVIIEFVVTDDASGVIKKIVSNTKDLDTATSKASRSTKGASMNWTELNSALNLGSQALRYVKQGLDATTGATVKYANEVRTLSQISGTSAEESSRLIQVLDDYKISVDDITTASKKLKDNGMTPTIDTVAKLAEQYQKIQDPAAKLKFAQDNLGKSTKDWLEVLNQSPEALRKQAAGISESLILSQKQLDAARKLEIAEDSLNDARQAAAVTLGNKLIPAQADFMNGVNVLLRTLDKLKENGDGLFTTWSDFARASDEVGREIWQEQEAMTNLNQTAGETGESMEDLTGSQEDAADAAKRLTDVYTGLLSSMFSIQGQNDTYAKTIEDITKKDEELTAKKNQLTLQMWEEQAAGKLTNDENLRYVQQLAEITDAQEENAQAREDAAEENAKAAEQRKYDLVQERLGADGIVSSGEYEYLQNLAVQRGLVSRAAADQAISESKAADAMVASFQQTLPPMERTLGVMQQIAGFNGTMVNFGVNFKTSGMNANTPLTPGGFYNPQVQAGGYANKFQKRDSGGAGMAGTPYLIGTGAQPELFTPSTNGTFTPANKMGTTYNITINNPVRETSEDSIRMSLKKLSFVGVAK